MIRRGKFEGFSVDMIDLGVNILAISAVSCIFTSWWASLSILLCHHTLSNRRKTLHDVYQELRAPFQYGRPNIHIFLPLYTWSISVPKCRHVSASLAGWASVWYLQISSISLWAPSFLSFRQIASSFSVESPLSARANIAGPLTNKRVVLAYYTSCTPAQKTLQLGHIGPSKRFL